MGFIRDKFDFKFSDSDNVEFNHVVESIVKGEKLIAIYGEAGTGKSTFIKELKAYCDIRQINIQCVAFTGKAAGNINGRTLHSYFGLQIRPYLPSEKTFEYPTWEQLKAEGRELSGTKVLEDGRTVPFLLIYFELCFRFRPREIGELDFLVIDEISMVRCDLLDTADIILRKIKGNDEPFGGVVVLFFGDKRQLPPVANESDMAVLENSYEAPFSYLNSNVISKNKVCEIVLNRVYRQSDASFINLLRGIRLNGLMPKDIETLNRRLAKFVKFDRIHVEHQIICPTNKRVDYYNKTMLMLIESEVVTYTAKISKDFPPIEYPTNIKLELKLGAKVMFLRNDREGRYYNGTIGQVRALFKDKVVVEANGNEFEVTPETWTYSTYKYNKGSRSVEIDGNSSCFKQIPLRLAWAITTHKAQGETYEKILCDLSDGFLPEHTYVTLSRCRSLEGITLLNPLMIP